MNPIIDVQNIGKKYSIGERQSYVALRDVLVNILRSPGGWIRGKKNTVSADDIFWALKDIQFSVEKGEVVGIIGRNGAGKSTLLKILSQITPPTEGKIKLRGRVGSLLEVGTGFHPELTGRENVYLNGAILGMSKQEITRKFDEIVSFAGIEKFLDTPVKRYSSGMYVRLAFSVAAHLDPEILLVDEVLAVGDAEFQKKCLGKMKEVTQTAGRTILFVSHNLAAIKSLCTRVIWVDGGRVEMDGSASKVISAYLHSSIKDREKNVMLRKDRKGNGKVLLQDIKLRNENGESVISSGDNMVISLAVSPEYKRYSSVQLKIACIDANENVLFRIDTAQLKPEELSEQGVLSIKTDTLMFAPMYCTMNVGVFVDNDLADYVQNVIDFDIEPSETSGKYTKDDALTIMKFSLI